MFCGLEERERSRFRKKIRKKRKNLMAAKVVGRDEITV